MVVNWIDDRKINEKKDEAVMLQRTSKEFGIVKCGSTIKIDAGMIFNPATGSFEGIRPN